MKYIIFFCIFIINVQIGQSQTERNIKANYNIEKGPHNKNFKYCIGAGRANEGLRADWQEQLSLVKKELDFKYIRMHGLFHDDMGVYFEDKLGNPIFNFQYIDVLYDFLLSIDIKPFVELSFMPSALASGEKTVFWWNANVTPPKDYAKWSSLIKALVLHLTERYGEDELKTWYFEVWNEPNHHSFWSSDMNEYFKLYDCTAKIIKEICPDYLIGGPATAGNSWIEELIQHCTNDNIPLDFISTHAYAVEKGFFDETGETGTILSQRPEAISHDVQASAKKIMNSPKPDLELHYTEWSSSYTPTDPIHDSYHEAAFILDKIKATESSASSMSYWTFSDIFEENGPRIGPFHGGFGLLNYQGIKKPAYFAYEYLNQLGNIELSNEDQSSWICKNNAGNIQILMWDFTITHPGDSVINQIYYKRNLPSKSKGYIDINLENIPEGKYLYELFKTGYQINDPFSTYRDLSEPSHLTKIQINTIKTINANKAIDSHVISLSGNENFHKKLKLRENDVFLIKLTKL